MTFDPTVAAIRFGTGLSPLIAPPQSVQDMLSMLSGPDLAAELAPIDSYANATPTAAQYREATIARRQARGTDDEYATAQAQRDLRADGRLAVMKYMKAELIRAVHTRDGMRERLTRFWADHFTVRSTMGITKHLVSPFIEDAIRANVAGNFGDMLVAVVGSPLMILYLDQQDSVGPNSRTGQGGRGLNENLAREVLELHTLGVNGTYTQDDVREFAELLTGVTANAQRGAYFKPQQAEPGPETVLGVTYGGDEESIEHVIAALRDLAVHPDTARHLSQKLAVHFVGPEADAEMVAAMSAQYLATGGDLLAIYEVMLNHSSVWVRSFAKVKPPFDFIASSMRALGVPADLIQEATIQDVRRVVERPLSVMGQDWQNPLGPDGWPEDAEAWVTPQGMAGRITWAMSAPLTLVDRLPDPRDFVQHALGPIAPDNVVFAANAAETVSDGIGIVLASAAFQRR